jgi:citrate lyase subunit beta/citryl-CoA lyase
VIAAAEEAARDGRGALVHEGELVDAPVLARARRILAASGESAR